MFSAFPTIRSSFQSSSLKKLTTQLTTHFVEALRTTTNNNKQENTIIQYISNTYTNNHEQPRTTKNTK
ncbi:hypothetical protein B6R18_01520 [Escherichia coli]|uniref:Uncharacterized protein n=1 Tax=Escherichia coli TaxID=562 RepID=A0A8S7JUR8_ECOLX|nr:hypothetical protein [Escherichia coli]EFN7270776.1 hypothetical protein [Escherichia coli O21]EEW1988494.1 hypothetical protein [Escherichia coli]EFB6147571.1 hypothetical protein [Escherichia coli]EFC9751637.1 hypothetical protein [Escherichia coli]